VDIALKKGGKIMWLYEVKVGEFARYEGTLQQLKDEWLYANGKIPNRVTLLHILPHG
jgi:hypothetical protein